MRVDGLGSHSEDSHQITNCHFDHQHSKKPQGALRFQSSALEDTKSRAAENSLENREISLFDWMKEIFRNKGKLWGKIWGESSAEQDAGIDSAKKGDGIGSERIAGERLADFKNRQEGTEREHLGPAQDAGNPYFVVSEGNAVPSGGGWKQFRRKIVQVLRGNLTRRRPADTNTFQPGKQSPREDQRRYSKFRKDDQEIDCILTDDSYLLDSYDKEGNYSKLTVGRK